MTRKLGFIHSTVERQKADYLNTGKLSKIKIKSYTNNIKVHITLQTAPRVHITEGAVQTAHARGDVTLRCDVKGRPTPTVTWLKDGDPLTPNNHDIALVDGSVLECY